MNEQSGNDPTKAKWLNRNVTAMGLTSLLGDASHEMVTAILPFFLAIIGSGPEARGRAFGFHRAMDTVGAIIGPSLALFFLTFLNYHQIIALSVIPGLEAFFVVFFFVREARKKKSPEAPIVSTHGDVVIKDKGFVKSIRTLPRPYKLFLVGVGVFGLGNFVNSLFTLRAQEVLALRVGALEASVIAVALYTLLNIAYAVCSFPIGALSDKVGRRKILAAGYFISAITCVGTAFLIADFIVLIPLFLIAGLFTAITDTVEGTAVADLLPTECRGTGFGVLQTVNGIGDFTSSAVVGALWALISPLVAFTYAGLLSATGGVILLYLTRGNHPLR